MKSNQFERAARPTRANWVRALFLLVLIAAAASPAKAGFTGGPTVRVSPNNKIEIRWIADFVGNGRVDVFDNANGGTPIILGTTPSSNTEHRVEITPEPATRWRLS